MTMCFLPTHACRSKHAICVHTHICFAKLRQIHDNMIFICIQNLRICITMKKAPLWRCFGWSWRESNPRPNRETIRFLHAYSGLRFSCRRKTRTTNDDLIP